MRPSMQRTWQHGPQRRTRMVLVTRRRVGGTRAARPQPQETRGQPQTYHRVRNRARVAKRAHTATRPTRRLALHGKHKRRCNAKHTFAHQRVQHTQLRAARRRRLEHLADPQQPHLPRHRLRMPHACLRRAHHHSTRAFTTHRRQRPASARSPSRPRPVRLDAQHLRRRTFARASAPRSSTRRRAWAPPGSPSDHPDAPSPAKQHGLAAAPQHERARTSERAYHSHTRRASCTDCRPTASPRCRAQRAVRNELKLTANATASEHSPPLTACEPQCTATSADAHAVSTLEHGPCRPSAKDTPRRRRHIVARHRHRSARRRRLRNRPVGTLDAEEDAAVAAHQPRAMGRRAAPLPASSSRRCCGSIAPASAAEMPKKMRRSAGMRESRRGARRSLRCRAHQRRRTAPASIAPSARSIASLPQAATECARLVASTTTAHGAADAQTPPTSVAATASPSQPIGALRVLEEVPRRHEASVLKHERRRGAPPRPSASAAETRARPPRANRRPPHQRRLGGERRAAKPVSSRTMRSTTA